MHELLLNSVGLEGEWKILGRLQLFFQLHLGEYMCIPGLAFDWSKLNSEL